MTDELKFSDSKKTIWSALSLQNETYVASSDYVRSISKEMLHGTFHHHFHIVWPLLEQLGGKTTYFEIGCYAGASLITALQCKDVVKAVAVDTFSVFPHHMQVVEENLARFVPHAKESRKIQLINGSSHDSSIVANAYRAILEDPMSKGIDLLFIDGDHSYNGVLMDFTYFEALVRPGGLIVFDDYADYMNSREVRPAVDAIVASNADKYIAIGQPHNDVRAFGNGLDENYSNEFILQRKKTLFDSTKAKYIIGVATYKRPNGSTNNSLRRFLTNLVAQSISDWFLIVIGDHYTDEAEFNSFRDCVPREKSLFINLPLAGEREDKNIGNAWFCAGASAVNYGLMMCQRLEHDCVYVHGDDDDVWQSNHLEVINNVYENQSDASFVWTMGEYINGAIYPPSIVPVQYTFGEKVSVEHKMPQICQTLHSSVSWRTKHLPFRYLIPAARSASSPSDGDMWTRMANYMIDHGLKSYLAKCVTMSHPTEN